MPPKRAAKKKQPAKSTPTGKSTSRKNPPRSTSSATKAGSSRKKQTPLKSQSRAPSEADIMAAFRSYAISRDDVSNPSDLSDDDEDDNDGEESLLLPVAQVRRCLRVLELPPVASDFFESQSYVKAAEFLELAKTLAEAAAEAGADDEEDGDEEEDEYRESGIDDDEDMLSDELGVDDEQAREIDEAFALFLGRASAGPNSRITIADLRRVAKSLKEDVDDKTLALMIEEANGEEGRVSVSKGVGRSEFENVMRRAKMFV